MQILCAENSNLKVDDKYATTKPGRMCQCDKRKKQATCEAGRDDKTNHEGDSI